MSDVTDVWRRIMAPVAALRAEQAATARRVRGVLDSIERQREALGPVPGAGAAVRRGFGRRASRPSAQVELLNEPFRSLVGGIVAETRRIGGEAVDRAFVRRGGRLDRALDHRKLVADLGMNRAVEVSEQYIEATQRGWRGVARPKDIGLYMEFFRTLRAEGWVGEPDDVGVERLKASYQGGSSAMLLAPEQDVDDMVEMRTEPEIIHRHALTTRVTHWVNVVCLTLLLMSGFQIFNAHPHLYWGQKGASFDPAIFSPGKFPGWATIPGWQDLATGRLWHLFFAWIFVVNGVVYLLHGLFSGHFRRDFAPTVVQLRGIGRTALDHLRLRFPKGEESKTYNVLQKFAYIGVVILLPLMLLTGLTMSPGVDAAVPLLLDVFGGRQSARTLHFIFAWSILGFVLIHLIAILAAGPINEIGSMITGRYKVEPEKHPHG